MKQSCLFLALVALIGATSATHAADEPRYQQRWFYASHNLLVEKNVDDLISRRRSPRHSRRPPWLSAPGGGQTGGRGRGGRGKSQD
jgi:hypothetical protein